MRRIAVLVSLIAVGLVAPGAASGAVAQDATPPPERWAAPPPEACTVEPRPLADYSAPVGTPRPSDVAPRLQYDDEGSLPGRPADPDTVEAIEAVAWMHVACLNAGDYRRNDALRADESFFRSISSVDSEELEEERAALAATPEALPPDERLRLDVRHVLVQEDGRVGAVVDYCGEANFYLFVRVGDRWLYDDEVPLAFYEGGCPFGENPQ